MQFQTSSLIASVWFALVASAIPASAYTIETCSTVGLSTVYLTVSTTVTLHDSSNEVYLTVSERTDTSATIHISLQTILPGPAATTTTINKGIHSSVDASMSHETVLVAISNFKVPSTQPDESMSHNQTIGQISELSQSYVIHTMVVTVEPLPVTPESPETSTVTSRKTISYTTQIAVMSTLPSSIISKATEIPVSLDTSSGHTSMAAGQHNVSAVHILRGSFVTRSLSSTIDADSGFARGFHTLITATDPISYDLYHTTLRSKLTTLYSFSASAGFHSYPFSTVTSSQVSSSTTILLHGNISSYSSTGVVLTASLPITRSLSDRTAFQSSHTTASSIIPTSVPLYYIPHATMSSTGSSSYRASLPTKSPSPSTTSLNSLGFSTITSAFSNQTSTPGTVYSSVSPTASSSAPATPTTCGAVGNFVLNFDDIPPLAIGNQSAHTIPPMPVFNPYHQFDFSDGFAVVPPPTDPYLPSSKPLLLEFIPKLNSNGTNSQASPTALDLGYSGEISNGDHGFTGCFSFNAYAASFGCDSLGPDCVFTFSGFRYNPTNRVATEIISQTESISACPSLTSLKCQLTPIQLNEKFRGLDSIRINSTVAGEPKIWWMDDLVLGWTNSTCGAGTCRLHTHIHKIVT